MMVVPIGVLQAAFFRLEVFGAYGASNKLYPYANFKVQASMVQEFEGHVLALQPRNGLYVNGEKLGISVRLFGDSTRELVGRWLRSMIDTQSLIDPGAASVVEVHFGEAD